MRVRPPSLPPFQVHPSEEPAHAPSVPASHHPKNWHTALIAIVMSAATGLVGVVGSKLSAPTHAEMETAIEAAQTACLKRIDTVKRECSREADDQREYIDEQIRDRVERYGIGNAVKKRKPARHEREQDE